MRRIITSGWVKTRHNWHLWQTLGNSFSLRYRETKEEKKVVFDFGARASAKAKNYMTSDSRFSRVRASSSFIFLFFPYNRIRVCLNMTYTLGKDFSAMWLTLVHLNIKKTFFLKKANFFTFQKNFLFSQFLILEKFLLFVQ